MYLRRNKVRCGETRRTYLSIAHNVWWAGDNGRKAQSRPVVVASFGLEDNIDVGIARDLVLAVERCAPKLSARRGESKQATMRIAQEVRRIEPWLKMIASRKLDLARVLPSTPVRPHVLERLVRYKLRNGASNDGPMEEEILSTLQVCLSA